MGGGGEGEMEKKEGGKRKSGKMRGNSSHKA